MKIKSYFIFINTLILLLFLIYLFYSFQKNYNLLLDSKTKQAQIVALNIKNELQEMVFNMSLKFKIYEEEHKELYYDIEKEIIDNPNYNLSDIQIRINNKYKDRKFDLSIISKDFKIINTTYKPDMNLDFKIMPSAYASLNKVYNEKSGVRASHLIQDAVRKHKIQYYIHKSDKANYMVQMGVIFDIDNLAEKYYNKIKQKYPEVLNYDIYALNDQQYKDKISVENIFNKTNNISKKDAISKLEAKEEFENKIYYKIFNNPMPKNTNLANNNLIEKLMINNNYIELDDHFDDLTLELITDFNAFNISQEPFRIGHYLYLQFDQSSFWEEINLFKIVNLLYGAILIFIVTFLLITIQKRIILPILNLSKGMTNQKEVITVNIDAKKDEISQMIIIYNNLLTNLKDEIKTNKYLLNENKQFIADMVHQIRTPMTVIMTNTSFIEMKSDENVSKYINQINSSINILSNSYEDLSYIISNDTIEYKKKDIVLSNFIEERIEFFDTIASANQKTLSKDIEKNIKIFINDIELERLIDNNISNAIKHSKDKSNIIIKLSKNKDNAIKLSFVSYGKQIKDINKIFETNYTENNHSKRSLGLGLNMVKGICEKNDIKYEVKTNGINEFTYTFK